MGKALKWAYVWVIGLLAMMAGIGSVENPENNLLVGVVVLYGGCGLMMWATVMLTKLTK